MEILNQTNGARNKQPQPLKKHLTNDLTKLPESKEFYELKMLINEHYILYVPSNKNRDY